MLKSRSFYYLRHGKTEANLQGLMCGGDWDLPLSTEGVQQAKEVAARISGVLKHPPIGLFSSPLMRAIETATIVGKNLSLIPVLVENLREWRMGSWDRAPFESVKESFLGNGNPEGGETRKVFGSRIIAALDECAVLGEPSLIVGHGAFGLVLQQTLGIKCERLDNCGLYHVFLDKKKIWKMEKL